MSPTLTGTHTVLQVAGNNRTSEAALVHDCLATLPAEAPASQADARAGNAAGAGPGAAAAQPTRAAAARAAVGDGGRRRAVADRCAVMEAQAGQSAVAGRTAEPGSVMLPTHQQWQPQEAWVEFACRISFADAASYFQSELRVLDAGSVDPLLVVLCSRVGDRIGEFVATFMRHGARAMAFGVNDGDDPETRSGFVMEAHAMARSEMRQRGITSEAFVPYREPTDVKLLSGLPRCGVRFEALTRHPWGPPQLHFADTRACALPGAKRPRAEDVASASGCARDATVRKLVPILPSKQLQRVMAAVRASGSIDEQPTKVTDASPAAVDSSFNGPCAGSAEGRAAPQWPDNRVSRAMTDVGARHDEGELAPLDIEGGPFCVSEPDAYWGCEVADGGESSSEVEAKQAHK